MLQMFMRTSKHKGVSFRTGLPITKPEKSSIREHSNSHDHPIKTSNFSILGSCQNAIDLRILESIYISQQKPQINDYQSAIDLNIVR
jgi:hypothetical protein